MFYLWSVRGTESLTPDSASNTVYKILHKPIYLRFKMIDYYRHNYNHYPYRLGLVAASDIEPLHSSLKRHFVAHCVGYIATGCDCCYKWLKYPAGEITGEYNWAKWSKVTISYKAREPGEMFWHFDRFTRKIWPFTWFRPICPWVNSLLTGRGQNLNQWVITL